MTRTSWALILGSVLGLGACAPGTPWSADSTFGALQPAPDGELVVTAPLTVLNRYGRLGTAASRGDKQLTLNGAQDFTALSLLPGDLLLVVQAQGAQIQTTDNEQYGVITATQGAGAFELVAVAAVDATNSRVQLDAACGGLRNDYAAAGATQVIRVPQYMNLTVNAGASVVGLPWNGQVGGIVAVRAQQTVTVHGELSATGQGFRGGPAQAMGTGVADQLPDQAGFVYATVGSGGAKGESIAGLIAQDGDGFGRGAPANGGGGGNAFKAGGGGGAGAGAAATWTGQGVMPSGVTGAAAWTRDPAYMVANKLTTSSGGGRGGYSASTASPDPLVVAPGDASWLGNLRRERGGRGGHPLAPEAGTRLFLGGGGGAGDQNGVGAQATRSGGGGAGGGLIYLLANTLTGDGRIAASGAPGSDSGSGSGAAQGAGGGGGGGAVVLNTAAVTGTLTIEASGGDGGRHLSAGVGSSETNGPGGGGGGGFIAAPSSVDPTVTHVIRGGSGGTSASAGMTAFPSNGATSGGPGTQQTLTSAAAAALCIPADLTVTVIPTQLQASGGDSITFTVLVTNRGPYDVAAAQLHAALTPAMLSVAWGCTSSDPDLDEFNCADPPEQDVGDINKTLRIPAGASIEFTVFVNLQQSAAGPMTYQATITAPPYVQDLVPTNNTASAVTQITNPADVQVQLLAAPNPSVSSQPITLTTTVRNVGPAPASGLQLDLQLPPGIEVHRPPGGPRWTCSVMAADGHYTCQNPSLGSGEVSEVWLAVLPDADATTLTTRSTVTTLSNDPDPTNNTATLEVPITFDASSYRKPTLGGGGFGCTLPNTPTPPSTSLPIWLLFSTLALLKRPRSPRA